MRKRLLSIGLAVSVLAGGFSGCSAQTGADNGKTVVTMVSYKQEAVDTFDKLEEKFNATHPDIELRIESPNDAMTVLKTRFIREDYPDLIAIGGDTNYSNFVDADILADVSDYQGLQNVKPAYLDMLEGLEYVPTEGTFGVPYAANAAGVLYNRDMFEEHGWEIPTNWQEFMDLCEEIQEAGIQPLYFGFKDTWTTLAPWNALAVDLADPDVCQQVNMGETDFSTEYREVAEKILKLVDYGEEGPVAYGYNDACTAFAKGQSAMYTIGSYAIPQILSVNPDMNIDSFVMPGNDSSDGQTLNSGIDVQFCLMKESPNKEAAYEVLDFLMDSENVQTYLDDQMAVPCMNGEFNLSPRLEGMWDYINEGKMADFQDHHYPSEMAVDAQIQTYLMNGDTDAFLEKFDTDWVRYNRDLIQEIKEYQEKEGA